jgi:sugar lactone lactonase YvrE
MRRLTADVAYKAQAEVGEAPVWDPERQALVWVDMPAGRVHLCRAAGGLESFDVGAYLGAALPAAGGGWLLADATGFRQLSVTGEVTTVLPVHPGTPGMRFNDAKCDPMGRAWAGRMSYDKTAGVGALYRLDPGPAATAVRCGLTVPNGLGWSPDSKTMWFADSANPWLEAFSYDVTAGHIAPGNVHRTVALPPGSVPDGLCVDADGCVWVALWGGGVVLRYTPQGTLDARVELPVSLVTSCAFGGADGTTLFITSARRGLSAEGQAREPLAGAVFALQARVGAPPATPWAGLDVRRSSGAGRTKEEPARSGDGSFEARHRWGSVDS